MFVRRLWETDVQRKWNQTIKDLEFQLISESRRNPLKIHEQETDRIRPVLQEGWRESSTRLHSRQRDPRSGVSCLLRQALLESGVTRVEGEVTGLHLGPLSAGKIKKI